MKRKAIFVDKDGTLVEDVPYNIDPKKIEFVTGALEAIHLLLKQDYIFIIVSNQSGIAKGYFSEQELDHYLRHLRQMLTASGIPPHAIWFCPHHPEGKVPAFSISCHCRKPAPGMIESAGEQAYVDLSLSWMIGDILDDVEAGNRAGCKTILLNRGNETVWKFSPLRTPHATVSNWKEASDLILENVSV